MSSPSATYRTPKMLMDVLLEAIRELDEKIDRQDGQIEALNERLDKMDVDFLKDSFQEIKEEIRAFGSTVSDSYEDFTREVTEFKESIGFQLQEMQEETLRVERKQWLADVAAAKRAQQPTEYAF